MFMTRNIKDLIFNKNIYFLKDIYHKCGPKTLESNHFSNTLVFNDL